MSGARRTTLNNHQLRTGIIKYLNECVDYYVFQLLVNPNVHTYVKVNFKRTFILIYNQTKLHTVLVLQRFVLHSYIYRWICA